MDIFSYKTLKQKVSSRGGAIDSLSWEEGASLGVAVMPKSSQPRRVWVLPLVLFFTFVIFLSRLVWLQGVKGDEYLALADNNRIRERVDLAPRGMILDTNGDVLADNILRYRVVVFLADVPNSFRVELAGELSNLLSLNREDVLNLFQTKTKNILDPVVVLDDLTADQRVLVATKALKWPGVAIESVPAHHYVDAEKFSHVLGYTGSIPSEKISDLLKSGYSRLDLIGKAGIESTYEKYLKGKNGARRVEVDAKGKMVEDLGSVEAEIGKTLELELDSGLQKVLYDSLASHGQKGAAVALNPKTGAVLALVSLPGFDNNKLVSGLDKKESAKIFTDTNKPLFNRALAGTYPPGSIVKPVVAAGALQEGVITDKTIITDNGFLSIPHRYNPSIIYKFYGWKHEGLGPLNVYDAVARSSDIFFYTVGGGHPNSKIEGLGVERLAKYYRLFGMGSPTGIDLPGEVSGLVPDAAWKAKRFEGVKDLDKWYLGDTYHLSIGQSYLLVTPMQAALWTATIANNGIGMKPHIIKKIVDHEGRTVLEPVPEKLLESLGVEQKNMAIVQKAMRETVLSGSAKPLLTLPISSAGKTGTSQFDDSDLSRTHAWFTSYAPFEDPQIVVTVLVESGGEGHSAALPVAKEALSWWANNRYCVRPGSVCSK